MIRIDEIYNNVFVPALQHRLQVGLHWFDPFGSTDIQNICNVPPVDGCAKHRYMFWDQEPLHRDRVKIFFDQYSGIYQGPTTIITSEYHSEDADWVCDTYDLNSSYYFFHAWAALDWYRGYNRVFMSVPFGDRSPAHTFLCPNNIVGGRRKHRIELLAQIVDRQLLHNNLISFPATCPYEDRTVADLCREYNISLGLVDLPLIIDNNVNHANASHKIDMWSLANRSLIHVVTETVYHGQKQHLTEKTFKPIVMQQPFIVVSCGGSLEYLRRYGFQTFSKFWNEDYDYQDDSTRVMTIGKLLSDLNQLSHKEKQQLQRHLVPVVEHNFQWFYSREFENLLWQEMTAMIKKW